VVPGSVVAIAAIVHVVVVDDRRELEGRAGAAAQARHAARRELATFFWRGRKFYLLQRGCKSSDSLPLHCCVSQFLPLFSSCALISNSVARFGLK